MGLTKLTAKHLFINSMSNPKFPNIVIPSTLLFRTILRFRLHVEEAILTHFKQEQVDELVLNHFVMYDYISDDNIDFVSSLLACKSLRIFNNGNFSLINFSDVNIELLVKLLELLEQRGFHSWKNVNLELPQGVIPAQM